ncbi:hypothetical protein ACW11F_12410, partial [Luteimonas sp. e5]
MLITCPPMAAMFFQGTLGHAVTMYSQFGAQGGQARDPAGNPVGGGGYRPADNSNSAYSVGAAAKDNDFRPTYATARTVETDLANKDLLKNQNPNRAK